MLPPGLGWLGEAVRFQVVFCFCSSAPTGTLHLDQWSDLMPNLLPHFHTIGHFLAVLFPSFQILMHVLVLEFFEKFSFQIPSPYCHHLYSTMAHRSEATISHTPFCEPGSNCMHFCGTLQSPVPLPPYACADRTESLVPTALSFFRKDLIQNC